MERSRDLHLRLHEFGTVRLVDPPSAIVEIVTRYYRHHLGEPGPSDCRFVFQDGLGANAGEVNYITRLGAFGSGDFFLRDRRDRFAGFRVSGSVDLSEVRLDERLDASFFLGLLQFVLQSLAIEHQASFLHASAVRAGGKALVLCAWSNTGKTETLRELLRRGHQFMGDDWCLVAPGGRVHAFLKAAHFYIHDLIACPELLYQRFGRLRGGLLRAYLESVQPSKLLQPRMGPRHRIRRAALRRAVRALGLLISELTLQPEEISPAGVAESAPMGTVVFMTRNSGKAISMGEIGIEGLVDRMSACYMAEVREFLDDNMLRFAFPGLSATFPALQADRMKTLLRSGLAGASIWWLRIPLDARPGDVADRIERCLDA